MQSPAITPTLSGQHPLILHAPKTIVPMHCGTWPILADEAAVKAAFMGDARLKVMIPGVKQAL